MALLALRVLLYYLSMTYVRSATSDDARALRQYLFGNGTYDKYVRPIKDQHDKIVVDLELNLLKINYLDEVTQVMKTTGFLYVTWTDQLITWDPAQFGYLREYYFPQGDVWRPDIALRNSYESFKELGIPALNVYIRYNGGVYWYPFQVFESTCYVDITYFPFDTQLCKLEFVAWSYTPDEVELTGGTYGLVLDRYEANPAWDIVDSWWEVPGWDTAVYFNLKLKRKPAYHILTLVLPIILLSLLNLSVFLLPTNSGEKSGFAVTVFLSMVVFTTIVQEAMPENSEKTALFSIYVILQTLQSTLITVAALIMVRCSTFDEKITKLPRWLIVVARFGKCKSCRTMCSRNKVKPLRKTKNDEVASNINHASKGTDDKVAIVLQDLEDEVMPEREPDNCSEMIESTSTTWRGVVNGLDVLCFVIFATSNVLMTSLTLSLSYFSV